jgi:hypothetical protein
MHPPRQVTEFQKLAKKDCANAASMSRGFEPKLIEASNPIV